MSLFTGEYDCKLDAKGRLALPSKVKSKLPEVSGNQLVLSMGLEPCLVIYTLVEYRKIFSQVASLNEFNSENRRLQRNFFRRVSEVELDSAGRLLIPRHMSLYAHLDKDITLVGMGNRLELWDAESYMQYIIKDGEEFSELVQKHLTER
jgi:MraZ protein